MAKRKIYKFHHPFLKTVCEEVSEFNEEIASIAEDMIDTLKDTKSGVGLAAPQIGITKRIILVRDTIIINPVIVNTAGNQVVKEGCLSYPGIEKKISRPLSVVVEGKDINGGDIINHYEELDAAIACHEVDHLNGICKVGERQKSTSNKRKKRKKS